MDIASFNVCKIFFFGFVEALDLKRILNKLRMECADIAAFAFATWQNRIVLISKFFFAEHAVVNLFWILQVSAVGLGN